MKVKYDIAKINNASDSYTVFVCHSNADDYWKSIVSDLRHNCIRVASDGEIKPGAPIFRRA